MPKLPPLKLVIAGVDKITAPVTKISRSIERMNAPIRAVTAKLRALDRASGFNRLRGSLARVGRELVSVVRNVALFATALAAAGASAFARFVGIADEIADTADAAGIGTEALQELRYAFDRAGVSQSQVDRGLIKFGKTLGDLRAGTGSLFTILKKTNPQFARQLAYAKSNDAAFELLIGHLADIADPAYRAAVATAAFGRSGAQMVSVVKDGVKPFDDLRKRARSLGLVLSDSVVRSAEETQDVWTDVKATLKGVGFSIAGDLLPAVLGLSKEFLAFLEHNREFIRKDLAAKISDAAGAVKELYEGFKVVAPPILKVLKFFTRLEVLLPVVSALIFGKVIAALAALGVTMAATPIGWLLAGVTAIALSAALIIKHWKPIKKFFVDLWDSIAGVISDIVNALPPFLRPDSESAASSSARGGGGSANPAEPTYIWRAPEAAAATAGAPFSRTEIALSVMEGRTPRVERIRTIGQPPDVSVDTGLTLMPVGGF